MKFPNTFVLLFLSAILVLVWAEEKQNYCGRRLAMTMAYVCNNNLVKRSSGSTFDHISGYRQLDWPWIAPQNARSLSRNKRQIVYECCINSCTTEELLTYCPN
uniref:Insulin-like peptide transcript variant X3 n=1 Tax=Galleria mellonella TaxID=7137 RepID=A0A6J3BXX0_GALME|nr:insulin-like peptide transcript variant X3 [Galleria mellonella]